MRNERGFTLVELMITVAVTMLLLVAVYGAVDSVQRSSSGIERKVAALQDVKPALNLMALEISMASFNPNAATNLWVTPSGACIATSANQNYRGIQEATTNTIAVEMDIGPGGVSDGALGDPNEVIRYNYDTVNQYITRETSCGGAQPFLGDIPNATPPRSRAVRVINNTIGAGGTAIPVFRYYDGTGTEIAAGSLPGAIPDIRRIDITLAVETEDIDPGTKQRRRMIYTTSVIPRNHAL